MLAVTEPTGNGIGGDNFAIVWSDGRADGLDSAGAAPKTCPHTEVTTHGSDSVTVPGAVGGWAALSERYGKLGLDRCLSDAIDAAENGFAVTPLTAAAWARGAHVPEEYLPAAERRRDRPFARSRQDASRDRGARSSGVLPG